MMSLKLYYPPPSPTPPLLSFFRKTLILPFHHLTLPFSVHTHNYFFVSLFFRTNEDHHRVRGEGGEVVVGGEGNAEGEGGENREGAAALLPPPDGERRGGGETSEEAGPTTTTTSATLREGGGGGREQTILSNQLESNLSTSLAKGKGQCYYYSS